MNSLFLNRRAAFSLVELSIVLVILGLLAGAILAGKSLIRASELRSLANEYNKYSAAVETFRDKYFALPGDMAKATQFWGTAAAGGACVTTASTDKKTCDGNGNNLLEIGSVTGSSGTVTDEDARFWQHLANAELITGRYSGLTGTLGDGKLGGWLAMYLGVASGGPDRFDGQFNHVLSPEAALLPEEAWNIDIKMDDGLPATGKIEGESWWGCTTATSEADMAAKYNMTVTDPNCNIVFRQQF